VQLRGAGGRASGQKRKNRLHINAEALSVWKKHRLSVDIPEKG
jgi:hypothetical protein